MRDVRVAHRLGEGAVQGEGRVQAVAAVDHDGRVVRPIYPDHVRAEPRTVGEGETGAALPVGPDHRQDVADVDGVDHQSHSTQINDPESGRVTRLSSTTDG